MNQRNKPFFSVIIPSYNRASFIGIAIDSVIRQSFQDWELIIVDDGSTDDTKKVILSYHDKRITYIYQEKKERCAARNLGILNSKGAYICFLDSDDYYLRNHLESFYNEISARNFPVAFFYCNMYYEFKSGNKVKIDTKEEYQNDPYFFLKNLPIPSRSAFTAVYLKSICSILHFMLVRTLNCG